MGDRVVLGSQQRVYEEMSQRGLTVNNMVRQILKICQKIESQVSSLNRLEAENNRLTASLNHVEANFLMLLRTSQAEIAKLKRGSQNIAKSSHRSRGISTLDPRRSIDHADLIGCLHTPLNYKIITDTKHIPALRCAGLRNAGRSSSSSTGSSSASSSSSSSSLSSSSASACQKRPPSHQHQQPLPLSASTSQRPLALVSSINSGSRTSQNHHFSSECNHVQCRNQKTPECLVSKPRVSMTSESAFPDSVSRVKSEKGKGMEKHLNPVMTDASTGVDDGPAAHLMRLVRASIRSAREHHSASVKLAPPTEGKYLADSEKAIIDAYYHAEEERCMLALKRPRSQSPQRSLPFSPTLFARRQMLKRSSLCSPNPPPSCNVTSTTNTASTSDPLFRNPVISRTSTSASINRTEAKSKIIESVSYPTSPASATAGVSTPHTPEKEVEFVDTDDEAKKVEKENKRQQKMEIRADLEAATGGEQDLSFNEGENRIHVDSPRIEIEDAISEVDSRPDAEKGEAMSEGEVNDEEEEDAMEEENRGERTINSNNNHRRVHRSGRIHDHQWFHRHAECNAALRHSPPKQAQHKPRHRVITSHERRCSVEGLVETIPSKRSRRLSDERESYTRFRNSPPRRAHNHPRVPAPRPSVSIACRRFLPTSGGGRKFMNVLVHRTRPSPAFTSHRSPAAVFRSSRRSVTQRSFAQRR
ncbi:hypothetical protein ECG_06480 [Echinococcus granulosus]|uniref:Expressed conserved protein n=1 Tax=Echinococcus granulosus TaxID=6210 RepID=A0A068WH55_ECHGR|nr:hypothetical protein ECG_06480 [Echinococcus granulosus]CDS19430.1 hypothetical protein EgrG_000473500 [Echinococcus granulosus]